MPAVAVNVVELRVAGTVTEEAETGSSALLLLIETGVPPAGAALLNDTVQVVAAFDARLFGLQTKEVSVTDATSPMAALCEAAFRVAVNVAF